MSDQFDNRRKPTGDDNERNYRDASNALVVWFNEQGISRADALKVMSKVAAKIIVDTSPPDRMVLMHKIDTLTLDLVNNVNARTFGNKWGTKRDGR